MGAGGDVILHRLDQQRQQGHGTLLVTLAGNQQGLLAGLNAARLAGGGRPDVTLARTEAYIGVLIDDLVTRGVTEPYRMFTSRAEYRLRLRADNADLRLTALGETLGCVSPERAAVFPERRDALADGEALLMALEATPSQLTRHGLAVKRDGVRRSAYELLSRPDLDPHRLAALWPEIANLPDPVLTHLATESRYASYLERQDADIRAYQRDERLRLPADLDYDAVGGLSNETRERLKAARPATLGAAGRLPGMTPAALVALLAHVRRRGPAEPELAHSAA